MTTFLLDLWQDLRAKRLWPIAVALLVGTVAVPVVLFKPAGSTPVSTGTTQAAKPDNLPTVALDASSVDSSHLNVFKQKNPFAAGSDPAQTIATATPPGSSTPLGTTPGAGSTGSTIASAASTASGSSSSVPASVSGSSSSSSSSSSTPAKHGVRYFTYTADVRFGRRGALKTYKSVSELDLLPNGKDPIVSFMGVKNAKTAVFFVADPAYRADGEGSCKPSPSQCMFLYMRTDAKHNQETLSTDNGLVKYDLVLTGLHVKTLTKDQAVGSTTLDKTPSAKRAKPRVTLLSLPSLGVATR